MKEAVAYYYLSASFEKTKNFEKANESYRKLRKFLNSIHLERLEGSSKDAIIDLQNKMKAMEIPQSIQKSK